MGWQIGIEPVRVLGRLGATTSDLVDAIRWAAGLAVLTVFVLFWAVGVLVLLLIQVASLWLPAWAAALLVLVVLLLVALGLAAYVLTSLALRPQITAETLLIRGTAVAAFARFSDRIGPPSIGNRKTRSGYASRMSRGRPTVSRPKIRYAPTR